MLDPDWKPGLVIDQAGMLVSEFWPAIQNGRGAVAHLMRANALKVVFQPIADLRTGVVYAHEALVRGPAEHALQSPLALFAAAQEEGVLYELELYCVYSALRHWGLLKQPGRLFINISARTLSQLLAAGSVLALAQAMRHLRVLPRMVVLELTEHERVEDMDAMVEIGRAVHGVGMSLALDDFGDGHSSLRLWSQLRPDIVKIDKYFSRSISSKADKLKTLQALLQIADVFNTALVAEGIENEADLRVIRDLGLAYGQGYFLGKPDHSVHSEVLPAAQKVLRDTAVAVLPQQRQVVHRGQLRHLSVIHAPSVRPMTTNDEVAALFQAHPDLHALAVVDDERPQAIINRQLFMDRYATLYFREVFGRKPCLMNANVEPRLIERSHDIEELVGILTSQDQRYLSDGFIVTENGRYVGLGTGDQLVRSVTELRLEAARHANPLTFLPGNIPITLHIRRLLDKGASFVACYLDLNHFKPFNDHYGYWRGDEMIRLLARLATQYADPQRDFVGHIGGDDFLILFQSNDWQQRCEQLIAQFAQEARSLFDPTAVQQGGIEAEGRDGVVRFFPCTTLSIGAVHVQHQQYRDADDVANHAAIAKRMAKSTPQGLHVVL